MSIFGDGNYKNNLELELAYIYKNEFDVDYYNDEDSSHKQEFLVKVLEVLSYMFK